MRLKLSQYTKLDQYLLLSVFTAYGLLIFCNALDAYNLIFIPFTWISKLGFIALAILILFLKKLDNVPEIKPLFYLIICSILVTSLNIIFFNYHNLMPARATTSYWTFVSLRFFNIFAFLSLIYITYWLFQRGYKNQVIKLLVAIGVVISIFAIYIYFAQIYGAFDLPRNRLGTSGFEQKVTSFYSVIRGENKKVVGAFYYNRALGTFREPSLLGAWLLVPLFLSFINKKSMINFSAIIIASAILLTWSISTILTIAVGFTVALLVAIFFFRVEKKYYKLSILLTRVMLCVIIAFSCVHISTNYFAPKVQKVSEESAVKAQKSPERKLQAKYKARMTKNRVQLSSGQVMQKRIHNIMMHGLKNSNRSYIYQYIVKSDFNYFGYGLGNSNILLGNYISNNFPPHYQNTAYLMPNSFLSLYINYIYSAGLIGLLLLLIFLTKPLISFLVKKPILFSFENSLLLLSAYISWLGLFAVHLEEFSAMFAVIFAFFVYEIYKANQVTNSNKAEFSTDVSNMPDPIHA